MLCDCDLLHFWCYQTRSPTRCDVCALRPAAMCTKLGLGDTLRSGMDNTHTHTHTHTPRRRSVLLRFSLWPRGLTCASFSNNHINSSSAAAARWYSPPHQRSVLQGATCRCQRGGSLSLSPSLSLPLSLCLSPLVGHRDSDTGSDALRDPARLLRQAGTQAPLGNLCSGGWCASSPRLSPSRDPLCSSSSALTEDFTGHR